MRPSKQQFLLRVRGSADQTGCQYRFRIDPASALTTESPGITAVLGPTNEPDDAQVLTLNGQRVGASGSTAQTFDLGNLAGDARIAIDATNGSGRFSWAFRVTNLVGRRMTTLISEEQSGGSSSSDAAARVGTVRHVVLDPSGNVLESCGELIAASPCIPMPPVDADKDGSPVPQDCNDASASVRPGLPEIVDNAVDENCDGVVAKRVRAATRVSLSRRGRVYRGRVVSTSRGCVGRRRVVLRRSGSGKRSFGSTTTRASGTWSISRKRLRGRVYVVVAGRTSGRTICRVGSSRRIRG